MIFYRSAYSQLQIELHSNETLGVLDTDYIEDWSGYDGAVSLYHVGSGQRFQVLMAEVDDGGPPHDYFRGFASLASLPDGTYQIQGRVRDVHGNTTILSAYQTPSGTETVELLTFDIQAGSGLVISYGPLIIMGAVEIILSGAGSVSVLMVQAGGQALTIDAAGRVIATVPITRALTFEPPPLHVTL